ncbi:BBE domain-containing protein [Oxalobacteraceae bacterium]|nr:BBE domain-containing protein [Oxalobacteraceae bacterium]
MSARPLYHEASFKRMIDPDNLFRSHQNIRPA